MKKFVLLFSLTGCFLVGACDKADDAKKAVNQAAETGKDTLTKMVDEAKQAATDQIDKVMNWNKKPAKDTKSEQAEPSNKTEQADQSSEEKD